MTRPSLLSICALAALTALTLAPIATGQGGGDIRRRTVAITYIKDPVPVTLSGTTLRPQARGEATVERWRKRNESEIDLKVEGLIPAYNYGGDFTTYVLWAITPAGQVNNLGELRITGGSGRLKTATPEQTFALMITAEPHYEVRLPSTKVILENLAPIANPKAAQVQSSDIYFTGDSGKYYTDTTLPEVVGRDYTRTPMELLQCRRAAQIARLADGERFDPDDYNRAMTLLQSAEGAFRRGAKIDEIRLTTHEAISLFVRTRDIAEEKAIAAERRAEIRRRDDEVRRVTENASDLNSRLTDTETRLKASEIARTDAQEQLNRALREAADARAESRSLRGENERLRSDLGRTGQELADARAQISSLRSETSSTAAELDRAKNKAEALERAEREQREAEARRRDFADLQAALGRAVPVKATANGFAAVLGDTFFVPNQSTLHVRAKAKMNIIAQTLAAHPNAVFSIEGHSDARANADSFALGRAQSVADYIGAFGVSRANLRVESKGSTMPVSASRTLAGRATNRRVEIVFVSP